MPDYTSDAGLSSHLQKQTDSIDEFKTEAGADPAEVTELKEDTANMAALVSVAPLAQEYTDTVFGIKRITIRGAIGAAVGKFKTAPDMTMPFPLVAGIEKRSRERDGRFKRAATITEAALIALDLKDGKPEPPAIPTPTVETFPAKTGYEFALVVNNRGDSDMAEVQIQRVGTSKWTTIKSGTGKAINITIEPEAGEAGKPIQLLVRVQLLKKNTKYGEPSEPAYVTVSP